MNNILFFGTYQHKVDSKGRVSIPSEWREHLINNELFIFDEKSNIYYCNKSINDFISFFDSLTGESVIEYNAHFKDLYKYNLDKDGRIRTHKRNCITTIKGCGDYFTIEFQEL